MFFWIQNNPLVQLLVLTIQLWALYLSFKRNNGFDLGSFLMALFFAPIYIVYYYRTEK
jgi:hypothetical protein